MNVPTTAPSVLVPSGAASVTASALGASTAACSAKLLLGLGLCSVTSVSLYVLAGAGALGLVSVALAASVVVAGSAGLAEAAPVSPVLVSDFFLKMALSLALRLSRAVGAVGQTKT